MTVHKSCICAVSVLILALLGCSPSGGGSSGAVIPDGVTPIDDPGGAGPAPTTGGVAILIRDNPLETIESLLLTITKVELLGGPDGPFELFDGSERIDILDFQATEFLLAMREDVPPGEYSKIRLSIEDPEVFPNPDGLPVHQTGNGKLDLNPQGGFEVVAGEFLAIRVDLDARRSIQVVANNNHFLLRPLVFVDIVTDFPPIPLGDLAGEITEVDLPDDEVTMLVPGRADDVVVRAESGTTIFDEGVFIAPLSIFEVGEHLLARGYLDSTGTLVAEVVLEGMPERLEGELTAGNDPSPFPLALAPEQSFTGSIDAEVVPEARIWREHGSEITMPPLAAGSRARITGQMIADPSLVGPSLLRGGLVDITLEKRPGTFESIDSPITDPAVDPFAFTFRDTNDELLSLTLDPEASISVIGSGAVPLEYLTVGLGAVVTISEEEDGSLLATALQLEPTTWNGTVTAVDLVTSSVTIDVAGVETTLPLRPDATILRRTDLVTVEVGLADLAPGDTVEAFGLFDTSGAPALWVIVWEFTAVSGTIEAIDDTGATPLVTVRDAFDRLVTFGVPADATVTLSDGTAIGASLLTVGLVLDATLEGLTGDLRADSITIETIPSAGTVTAIDPVSGVLTVEAGGVSSSLTLLMGATVDLRIDAVVIPADASAIAVGDTLQATGIPHPAGGFIAVAVEVFIDTVEATLTSVDLSGTAPLLGLLDGAGRAFGGELDGAPMLAVPSPIAIDPSFLASGLAGSADLDGTTGVLRIAALTITPVALSGPVTAVDSVAATVELGGFSDTLHVRTDAVLIEQTESGPAPLDLSTLVNGTAIEVLGLPVESAPFEVWHLETVAP